MKKSQVLSLIILLVITIAIIWIGTAVRSGGNETETETMQQVESTENA